MSKKQWVYFNKDVKGKLWEILILMINHQDHIQYWK
jgi:hypothetical protein